MIRLVVFTDEPLVSVALPGLIASAEDIRIVQICSKVQLLGRVMEMEQPDVLLLSVIPEVNGRLVAALQKAAPACRIILWVSTISTEAAHQAMQVGVRGILRRSFAPAMVLKCVRKVYEGEFWFEKSLTSSFLTGRTITLTRREGQLVALLAQGLKNKEISELLSISEGTVKVYLSRLFEKVGARDRFELALFGLRNMEYSSSGEGPALVHPEMQEVRSLFLESIPKDLADRKGFQHQPAAIRYASGRG